MWCSRLAAPFLLGDDMDNLYEYIADSMFDYGTECEKYAGGCHFENCRDCIKNVIKNHDNKIINDFVQYLQMCTLWDQQQYDRLLYLKKEYLKLYEQERR